MTSRMEKLQRQRALLQEHLRWIESEIAAEASNIPSRPAGAPTVVDVAPPAPPTPPADAAGAPAIVPADLPEADVRGIHNEVRSGCLLYFAIAFVGMALLVGIIYWLY
ncbi:MAG: hypothetical protein IAE82_09485 [Opitutaceae bacterium]|nr:hypothetical protein [Opitutaceae bacterium]